MVKNSVIHIIIYACCVILSAACSDDNDEIINTTRLIELSESEISMPISGRYYDLKATTKDNRELMASSDAEWLTLNADTVATDGIIEFYAHANEDEIGRDASISVYDKNDPTVTVTVKVHQRGPNESDTNDGNSIYDKFRMGYGYNIFKNYMDDDSKTLPIFDSGNPTIQEMIQISLSNKEEVEHVTANTLTEMTDLLTRKEEKSKSGISGNKNTSIRFEQNGTLSKDESWFSYIRLYRTVATAGMDLGMFQQAYDKNVNTLFTEDFKKLYKKMTDNHQSPTDKDIDNLLNTYGTHIIVQSDLGGSMDLTLNFKRTMTGSLNIRAEDFSGYFFNGENLEYDKKDICTNIDSKASGSSAFKIVGGSESTREAIKKSINGNEKRIKSADLLAWQHSMDVDIINEIAKSKGIVPVNFRMIPIASLFPKPLQKSIFMGLLRMSEKSSNNALSDLKVGTDKYAIRLRDADFMKFSNQNDASLVRVLYASNQNQGEMAPILEICNEYVPAIRGDKRITVVYAIRNGRTFHGAGLFPGDGEGNPPAWLTFSEDKIYVDPIKNKSTGKTLDVVYYMHGNIYETDLGLSPSEARRWEVEEHYCNIIEIGEGTSKSVKLPCVKIGSGYWLRSNSTVDLRIVMHMGDMTDDGDAYEYSVTHPKGKYYAGLYGDMNNEFLGYNNEYVGKQKWFLPTPSDVNNLRYYMGNNPKAFFKGQASGFNAEFDGYYGQCDIKSGKRLNEETFRYLDEVCCIACRTDWDHNGNAEGCAMLLWPDYKLGLANDEFCRNSYFPVRLFRTSNFPYPSKKN